ncbi:MAG: PspC domain-containing protein [Bacteroidota bacterium]
MESIKYFVEKRVYGVCSYIGERFGISSSRIRLYFIYTSFITMGSPIIIYLVMAFWLNIKKYIRNRKTAWDL